MAFKGVFVGINKYVDPGIPELSGARRDAMALWALFTDTIEQLIPSEVLIEARSHASATGCGSYIAGALKCNPGCPPEPG